jgi:hypothetical protein
LERDKRLQFKNIIAQSGLGADLNEDDLAYITSQQDTIDLKSFDRWFSLKFNVQDPGTLAWAQDVYKEFYEEREQALLDKIELFARISLIQLRGCRSTEDLMLKWQIDTGRLILPLGWESLWPSRNLDYNRDTASIVRPENIRNIIGSNPTDLGTTLTQQGQANTLNLRNAFQPVAEDPGQIRTDNLYNNIANNIGGKLYTRQSPELQLRTQALNGVLNMLSGI